MRIHSRSAGAALVLLASLSGSAWGCAADAQTRLGLTVTPGEILGVAHVLEVGVRDDGCVRVRRPAHWRAAGRFEGPASAALLGSRDADALAALDDFDEARVRAELDALERSRGQAFAVEGADRYVLRWIDATGQRRTARFDGIFQYAERYPERADLAAFAALVTALQDEAAREDLVALETPR